ncbi:MAG: FIST C-terminal domain-containing protein [Desulfobulbus sp.]|nr:FIST C-terminal domain-containing protein [Desulfobulbus sp.]
MTPRHFPSFDPAAVAAWLDELAARHPRPLVCALLPEAEQARVGDLQGGCNERGLDLLGAIFPALLTEQGFTTHGLTLVSIENSLGHFLVPDLAAQPADAAEQIVSAVTRVCQADGRSGPRQLFLVFDSMLPSIASILVKLFDRLKHDFTYAGVNAGSETFQPMPCLFDNQRLLGNGVIGMILDGATRIAVEHSYPVAKSLMRASSTAGNRIDKIDGRPAMTVYQQVIAADFGIELTPGNFYDYAVHYPFGLVGSLEILVRIPVAFNEDGSIFCVGEVPANSMLRLLKAPALENSACIRTVLRQLGPASSAPLLTFYCAGRRLHFGEEAASELRELQADSGATAIHGALSLGEISTDSHIGIPEFHNAALVCLR